MRQLWKWGHVAWGWQNARESRIKWTSFKSSGLWCLSGPQSLLGCIERSPLTTMHYFQLSFTVTLFLCPLLSGRSRTAVYTHTHIQSHPCTLSEEQSGCTQNQWSMNLMWIMHLSTALHKNTQLFKIILSCHVLAINLTDVNRRLNTFYYGETVTLKLSCYEEQKTLWNYASIKKNNSVWLIVDCILEDGCSFWVKLISVSMFFSVWFPSNDIKWESSDRQNDIYGDQRSKRSLWITYSKSFKLYSTAVYNRTEWDRKLQLWEISTWP